MEKGETYVIMNYWENELLNIHDFLNFQKILTIFFIPLQIIN